MPEPRAVRRVVVATAEPSATPTPVADQPVRIARHVPAMSQEEIEAARRAAAREAPPLSGEGFLWPVKALSTASATSRRGRATRHQHPRTPGTPVLAAENGVVVHAGEDIPSFGRMLLIRHAEGFTTTYAHNAELGGVGDRVRRGQRIALVGATGEVGQPQLHFEIRIGHRSD